MNIKDLTGRLARWSLFIQQFDFEIKYRPGTANGNADALSYRVYSPIVAVLSPTTLQTDHVREMQRKNSDLAPIIDYLETKSLPSDAQLARNILHL